jgi:hypothetical protein
MTNKDKKKRPPDRIIECPVCESAWNVSAFTQCDCGAKMLFAEPGNSLESIPSSEPAIGMDFSDKPSITAYSLVKDGVSHPITKEQYESCLPPAEPAKESQPTK